MSDSRVIEDTVARGIFASCAIFVGLAGGAAEFGSLYDASRHKYNLDLGDMDPGGLVFAVMGAILGAATGTVLYFFCARNYRFAGIIALVTWLLCSPACFPPAYRVVHALFTIAQKSDAQTRFEYALSVPVAIWWIAFLVCGIAGLLVSFRYAKSVSS